MSKWQFMLRVNIEHLHFAKMYYLIHIERFFIFIKSCVEVEFDFSKCVNLPNSLDPQIWCRSWYYLSICKFRMYAILSELILMNWTLMVGING